MNSILRLDLQDRVAILTMDRPERLNAIGSQMLHHMSKFLAELEDDPKIGAIVITGEGPVFSAGADINEIRASAGPQDFSTIVRLFTNTYAQLQGLAKPSVAAVDGIALGGGCELALACDLRVASRRARFGVPEIKLGLLPAAGGSQRLSRLLPAAIAKQLMLTGDPLGAEDAYRFGLINEVVDAGQALPTAIQLARTLSGMPPLAVAAAKRLVDVGGELSLDAGIVLERETVSMLYGTEDRREGMAAFLEKRPPMFHGR